MLPKNRRISRKEFPYIIAKGKRYNSPHLLLYLTPRGQENMAKESLFSFSVSKKVCKKATDRNKYRRRGYSVVSRYLSRVKPGYFCFFSFKKGITSISFSEIEKEIQKLLSEASVLS